MPVVNPLVRELVFKVVYYGPGLGGKTTSLQYVHRTAKPEHRGKMVSLATPVDRTLYFDFLPIRVPSVRGMGVRLQLFTVPGQVYYDATRKLVLTGVDGIVIVFDSQRERMDANVESLENLRENLRAHGKSLDEVPHVIQYNKRDLEGSLPLDELERVLNHHDAPSFTTTATSGEGVYEALEAITRAVLDEFACRMPESRGVELTARLELPEGGLVEALRRAEQEPLRTTAVPEATLPPRHSSSPLNLSHLPEADPGEAAARVFAGETERPQALRPTVSPSPSQSPTAMALPNPNPPSVASALPPIAPMDPVASSERASKTRTSLPLALAPNVHSSMLPPAAGFSFEILWPSSERATVQDLERALGLGDFSRAVSCADRLVARALASAGALLGGSADAPRDPSTAALLLGLDGWRYLELRALVRDARAGRDVPLTDALKAYAVAIEARVLRARVGV